MPAPAPVLADRVRTRLFGNRNHEARIADAIDAAVVEITYICADDQRERITAAIGVLAVMLSDVPMDSRAHALQMATDHTARLLGVDAPAIDNNAVNFKRPA